VIARILFAAAAVLAAAPACFGAKIVKIDVYPPEINLKTQRDFQRVLVVATRDDDVTVDVTADATTTVTDDSLARVEKTI